MSRIGKQPVTIPGGVEVKVNGRMVNVKGPKGQLSFEHPFLVSVAVKDGMVVVERDNDTKDARARHGLVRALVQNMVTGVNEGFKRELEIQGVGYRAQIQGQKVVFSLGYSHTIDFAIPQGIEIDVDAKTNHVTVKGIDRQQVGQVAAEIRALRPPEPYKGKGIRYADERVRTKAGKQGATV